MSGFPSPTGSLRTVGKLSRRRLIWCRRRWVKYGLSCYGTVDFMHSHFASPSATCEVSPTYEQANVPTPNGFDVGIPTSCTTAHGRAQPKLIGNHPRSEERRVGKECRS